MLKLISYISSDIFIGAFFIPGNDVEQAYTRFYRSR